MTGYRITAMQVKENDPDANGVTVLANFDYEDGRYTIRGASIVKFHNEDVRVSMPMLRKGGDVVRSIRLTDQTDYYRLRDAAFKAYIALGGDAGLLNTGASADR